LLQKTMGMAEGVGRQLNPDANMWPIARDLASEWAEDQGGMLAQISAIADKALAFGMKLPDLLDRAETILNRLDDEPEPLKPTHHFLWVVAIGALSGVIFGFFII